MKIEEEKTVNEKKIVKAMLRFAPCPELIKKPGRPNFEGWGLSKETVTLLEKDPNAFLMGAIFDRGILAEEAWEKPYLLKTRLGHLDLKKISRMSQEQLQLEVGRQKHGKSLHRFYKEIPKSILLASKLLIKKYNGNANNIWPNGTSAEIVSSRLLEFYGIGQKISNMVLTFLVKYYGIFLTHWDKIDIAVDRNVARVFLRTGLIASEKGKKKYPIYEIKGAIIEKARNLYPNFPGALDEPAYSIGKEWCTAEEAYCDDEEEACPLTNICTKRKRSYQVY